MACNLSRAKTKAKNRDNFFYDDYFVTSLKILESAPIKTYNQALCLVGNFRRFCNPLVTKMQDFKTRYLENYKRFFKIPSCMKINTK